MEPKRLYRSVRDRMLLGVCGGIGEYFGIDATVIRVIWAVFGCTGAGILAYFIAAVIMPQNPGD
ncbi:MAG TPA: PspC domain-containing protein [Firmicutes bacterium]|nr:PspC domain-containing protein [Bacillota bacterium]